MSEADTQSHILKEHLDYVNRRHKGTFSCIHCFDDPDCGDYASRESLWKHCLENHSRWFPTSSDKLLRYREAYEDVCYRAAKVKSTNPVDHVNGKLAPSESVFASSNPPGPVVSSRIQDLVPEPNESLSSPYDQDDGEIHLELPSAHPASHYTDSFDSVTNHEDNLHNSSSLHDPLINNEDDLPSSARHQADIAGEPLKVAAGLPWRQRLPHVEVTHNHIPLHSYLCDSSNLPSNYRDDTSHNSNYRDSTRDDDSCKIDVAISYGPRAGFYSGISNLFNRNKNKIREASSDQTDIPAEHAKLASDVLSKHQHALIGSPKAYSESSIRTERGKPIEPPRRISQLDIMPISQGLLVTEGKEIYAGLTGQGRPRGSKHKGAVGLRHRENPCIFSLNAKPRENRRKVLRVRINGQDHLTCPDSGSEKNIISKACAVEHGFRIRRKTKDIKRFEVGNGDIVWSIGRVLETVGLPGSPLWQKKRRFYVLEDCPVPLVMGMKFLKEAEILTKYRHLLENCPAEISNIPSLLWIGSPRSRIRCTIDGRKLEAVADTGSDLNLMSLECAAREGFRIDARIEARTTILLGNNKKIETLGQVYVSNLTLDWREPESDLPEQSPHAPATDEPLEPDGHGSADPSHRDGDDDLYTIFHVVKHLPCEVVFGQKFLDDRDAFNKWPELLDIPPTKWSRQFGKRQQQFEFKIYISEGFSFRNFLTKRKPAVDVREQHESNWHNELHRRSKNTEEKIGLLPLGEQDAARRSEAKKVRDWHFAHARCQFCNSRSAT
ncbi:hypothetical protein V499_06042 [Pseudogymnoascus sp. VKM F-103]|uniref:Uncharacterized protein n=1 Tax=Pseudogymnoascus verrucosus TaxID=342668 RepID=A0A1B8GUS5_9PEZI|nr:uncharacterized protein VE01_02891 [Pseudogymnoascus verrucosus]KFY73912.1 hypothetical protein V499_06042 [Pseudogymnoascus sp. VKM F-103]OBT99589.1 hypothetical protein VE01_02891 [Pseudogymnoascus verrucosus]